jgi:hypothetical protein
MAAISYAIAMNQLLNGSVIQGSGLEAVVPGTNAPTSTYEVEIRIDQTTTAVTDAQSTTGTRALKKGEVIQLLNYLIQYAIRDTNLLE